MGRTLRERRRKGRHGSHNLASDSKFVNCIKWMCDNGWQKVCHLRPAEFHDTGRGLMACQTVGVGDIIVSVPTFLLVTTATVYKSEFGGFLVDAARQSGVSFTSQQVLASYLVWEKHLGEISTWSKYLATLPVSFSTPHFLSKTHFDVLPEFLRVTIRSAVKIARKNFSDIVFHLGKIQCEHCKCPVSSLFSWDNFLWAWCCVNTRAIYIDPDKLPPHKLPVKDRDCLALAPFLDMFNHSNTAKVDVHINPKSGCYEIRTLVSYTKFREVFINYGPHSNIKLYTEYGFVIPSNVHDTVPLSFEDLKNSYITISHKIINEKEKTDFLEKQGFLKNLFLSTMGLSWNGCVVLWIFQSNDNSHKVWEHEAYNLDDSVVHSHKILSETLLHTASCKKQELNHSLASLLDKNSFERLKESELGTWTMCRALLEQLVHVIDLFFKTCS